MSIELGKDALYYPRVVKNLGVEPGGISANYGLLCITQQNLYYIPKHILDVKRTSVLSEHYAIKEQKAKKYQGMNFEDVLPEVAKEFKGNEELEKFLTEMAQDIPGSCEFKLADLHGCQFGYFAQFTFINGEEKYKFSVGGKKKREEIRIFLQGRTS